MPYQFNNNTGVIVPDESGTLNNVRQEFRDVFGAGLDVSEESPQGKLITAEVIARTGVAANNAAIANQINPNLAEGVFLDALWALLGGQRQAATRSSFSQMVDVSGVPGTVIPAGSIASTSAGDQFQTTGVATLDDTGSAQVGFVSVEFGPIPCPLGALSNIETVNFRVGGSFKPRTCISR